jgi:hypothetical protein
MRPHLDSENDARITSMTTSHLLVGLEVAAMGALIERLETLPPVNQLPVLEQLQAVINRILALMQQSLS